MPHVPVGEWLFCGRFASQRRGIVHKGCMDGCNLYNIRIVFVIYPRLGVIQHMFAMSCHYPSRFASFYRAVVGLSLLLGGVAVAHAGSAESFKDPAPPVQQVLPRHFPDTADKGHMRFVDPPEVVLDGVRVRISPGARIKDERNMMLHMSQLKGHKADVMYVRDAMQQIGDIWILSDYEKSQPSPKQKRDHLLRMDGYDPSKHKFDPMLPYNQQPKW